MTEQRTPLSDSILERVLKVIVGVVEIPTEIEIETSLASLGINSIRLVKIVVELERSFNIEIADGDLRGGNFVSAATIVRMISKYLSGKAEENGCPT